MIEVPWWGYLAGFILAGTLSWLLTPVTRWVAVYLEIFDHPGDYKQQSDPVPYLGGLAIVAAYTLVVSLVTIVIPVTFRAGSQRSCSVSRLAGKPGAGGTRGVEAP